MSRRRAARAPSQSDQEPVGQGTEGTRVGVAFPGQGVDPLDVARLLHEHADDPLVDALADAVGTRDWNDVDLNDTRVGQPCVYVASVLSAAAAGAALPARDELVAFGHSLGELSAAAFAGACTPSDGLALVVRRAALGHGVDERRPGRMIVVMRLDEHGVEWVRRTVAAATRSVLELAVVNGTGQFVLSGDVAATTAALDAVADLGGVARALPIGGAYHSPVMAEIVPDYTAALEAAITADPSVPMVSCTTGAVLQSREELIAALARALVLPVRWLDVLQAVRDLGVVEAVDVGPSRTLANLARFSPIVPFRSLRPD